MTGKFATYAAAALLVHFLSGCGQPAPEPPPEPVRAEAPPPAPAQRAEDERLVLAFGDSLYAGFGLAPGESFPQRLEEELAERGIAARVHNAGVSGDTSSAGLQRLRFTLEGLPRTPDLVVLGLGGNDMLRGLDPERTRENLDAIMTELRARGIDIVLTGMVAAPNLGRDYAERFNAIFPELARKHGAEFYPFFLEGVVTDERLMLPDRIHPNAEGVSRIAERIAPLVAGRIEAAPAR